MSCDNIKTWQKRQDAYNGNGILCSAFQAALEEIADLRAELARRDADGEHVAYSEGGVLKWMTGRKFDNCELYTRPAVVSEGKAVYGLEVTDAMIDAACEAVHGGMYRVEAALKAASRTEAQTWPQASDWLPTVHKLRFGDIRIVEDATLLPGTVKIVGANTVTMTNIDALVSSTNAAPAAPTAAQAPGVAVTLTERDLAMLIQRLVRALAKISPDSDLIESSYDYLQRKGLQGSPLRILGERMRDANAPKPFPSKRGY